MPTIAKEDKIIDILKKELSEWLSEEDVDDLTNQIRKGRVASVLKTVKRLIISHQNSLKRLKIAERNAVDLLKKSRITKKDFVDVLLSSYKDLKKEVSAPFLDELVDVVAARLGISGEKFWELIDKLEKTGELVLDVLETNEGQIVKIKK